MCRNTNRCPLNIDQVKSIGSRDVYLVQVASLRRRKDVTPPTLIYIYRQILLWSDRFKLSTFPTLSFLTESIWRQCFDLTDFNTFSPVASSTDLHPKEAHKALLFFLLFLLPNCGYVMWKWTLTRTEWVSDRKSLNNPMWRVSKRSAFSVLWCQCSRNHTYSDCHCKDSIFNKMSLFCAVVWNFCRGRTLLRLPFFPPI